MSNNTTIRTNQLRATAAAIVEAADTDDSQATLEKRLMLIDDCSKSAAQRHIKAALELADPVKVPIGRPLSPWPLQRINVRCFDNELLIIKPEVTALINALLAEVRAE